LIPDAPRPSTNPTPTPPTASHVVDGVIGTFHAETQSTQASHTNPKSNTSNVQNTPTPTPSTGKTSEVNSVQSTPTGKNQNKKKGKGKNKEDKNNNPQSDKPKTQPVDDKDKRKPRYPCLICGDDHYTKDCPRRAEVTKFLQGTGNLLHLSFCHNLSLLNSRPKLVIHDQPSPSTTSYVLMCTGDSKKNEVASQLEPKITLLQRRKLMIYHLRWFNLPPPTSPPNGPLHLE
jgi:DNA mismatch repair ATPase MutL